MLNHKGTKAQVITNKILCLSAFVVKPSSKALEPAPGSVR